MITCEHILQDVNDFGGTSYTYCSTPYSSVIHGVPYCANHAVENDRRERIQGLIQEINAHRTQS